MTAHDEALVRRLSNTLLGPSVRGDRKAFEAAVSNLATELRLPSATVRATWLLHILAALFPGAVLDVREIEGWSTDVVDTLIFYANAFTHGASRYSSRAS